MKKRPFPLDSSSGTRSASYRLSISVDRIIYRFIPAKVSYLIVLIILIFGLCVIFIGSDYKGVIAILTAGLLFYAFNKNRTSFNIQKKEFYSKDKKIISFKNIKSGEILEKLVPHGVRPFKSYEFNLILLDDSRLNVVDHGKYEILKKDAITISQAIGCPLQDFSDKF